MAGLKPALQAFLMCDGAMNVQGKWTLQGLFSRFHRIRGRITPEAPLIAPPHFIYLRFGEMVVSGSLRIDVEITDSTIEDDDSKGAVCGQGFAEIKPNGQESVKVPEFEVPIPILGAVFHHPGKYDATVYFNKEILEVRSIDVMEIDV